MCWWSKFFKIKPKQRKSLPWRFENVILIIIKFCELLLRIFPRIINSSRSYIKHSKECFLLFPNTSKLVQKTSAAPRFSNLVLGVWKSEETLFLVFDLLRRFSCFKGSSLEPQLCMCSEQQRNLLPLYFEVQQRILCRRYWGDWNSIICSRLGFPFRVLLNWRKRKPSLSKPQAFAHRLWLQFHAMLYETGS